MDFLTKEIIYQKSSQEITSLLYEALIDHTKGAIQDIEASRLIEANDKLKKVNDILERLGVGINYEAGIIAEQLDVLYNYMADLVIKANVKKDIEPLKEVLTILEDISGAWQTAMKNNKSSQIQQQLLRKTNAYERNVMVYEREPNTVEEGK
ncbi:flagellar export chaperone FliS [Metabacillus litoralis]|uniref:flagellar export chaperone FliS n=1 Tax=Bacillaceae TaxID=186817 RepID=UPI000BFDE031|nr:MULTISPECIES: flagellar export chaperone FliS [Bacillaceae]PGT81104.1 flagellar export chaperone FliS [Bacillus sp. AFS040349]UHA61570.1 flagellar export chaperone FliS [Metabacillus litoralis]